MPIDYRIDQDQNRVYASAHGTMTTEQLFDYQKKVWSKKEVAGMDELVDHAMVIRFRVREPDVELWVDGRAKPVQTSFGTKPDLDATLTADLTANSMHELLLGTLPLGKAMLFRKLKVQGSKSKAMKLEGLLHTMQAVYPALADEMLCDG